jgi:imidazole glycerol-phosphate synthase subunit HisF
MLKKRLVGVITVKDGWAVQSFGYRRYLPLGHPEYLAENLDRWGADEILVLSIDRTRRGLGPDLDLVRRLGGMGLSTPLAYGGGLRGIADAGAIIQAGAERVCVDAIMRSNDAVVRGISALVGAQAVIGALPLSYHAGDLQLLDYVTGHSRSLTGEDLSLFAARVVSEALIIDWRHEGDRGAFDMNLIRRFPTVDVPLIAFGGVSETAQLEQLFGVDRVAAIGVGNFLSYREHAVQLLKRGTGSDRIRPALSVGPSR